MDEECIWSQVPATWHSTASPEADCKQVSVCSSGPLNALSHWLHTCYPFLPRIAKILLMYMAGIAVCMDAWDFQIQDFMQSH